MDCHNPYGVIVLGGHFDLPHCYLFFLDRIDVTHKAVQGAVLGFAISGGFVHQRPQVCLSLTACGQGTHSDIESGGKHKLPYQFLKRQNPALLLPLFNLLQSMSRLLAKRFVPAIPGIRLKSAVIRALLEFAPHLRKLRYGVAQNFRAHYRE